MGTLCLLSSFGGATLQGPQLLDGQSNQAPAMAVHANEIHLGFTGTDKRLNLWTLGRDGLFGSKVISEDTSDAGPALASFTNSSNHSYLYMAFRGTNDDIYVCSSEKSDFSNKVNSGNESDFAPAIAAMNGRLFLAFTGTNDHLYIRSATNGLNFGDQTKFDNTSQAAPALAYFKGRLYMAFTGKDNGWLNVWSSSDGVNFDHQVILSNFVSHFGPSLAVCGDELLLTHTGRDAHIYTAASKDGTVFTQKTTLPIVSAVANGVAALGEMVYWAYTESADQANVGILKAFEQLLVEDGTLVAQILVDSAKGDWAGAMNAMSALLNTSAFASLLSLVSKAGFKTIGFMGGAEGGFIISAGATAGLLTGTQHPGQFYSYAGASVAIGITEGLVALTGLFVANKEPQDCGGIEFYLDASFDAFVGGSIQPFTSSPGGASGVRFFVTTGEEIEISVGTGYATVKHLN